MKNLLDNTLLFFVGLLVFILPIAHTLAIRNISIAILILIIIYLFFKKNINGFKSIFKKEIKNIVIILCLFTFWLYFVAFFISNETSWTLGEIKSQWIIPLVYFLSFAFISLYSINESKDFQKNFYTIIFLMLFVHVLYVDLFALKYYIDTKTILSRFPGLTEGPDKSSYITNVLLAFIVSEIIYRFRFSKRIININNFILTLILLVVILSALFEGMRNGVVAIVFLGISGMFFSFYKNEKLSKKLKITSSILLILLISIPAIYNFKTDTRWSSLLKTVPIAVDTKNNKAWIDVNKHKLPYLDKKRRVSKSNYLRIAWGYEGLKLIGENPLGKGYGRNIFSHLIKEKYDLKDEETNIGHSHSGLIDLTIGVGIPGLFLWVSFGLYLMYLSYTFFIKYNSFFALILFFNVSGFFSRFIIDSNMRDHMFQTFMLIIGFSLILMLKDKYEVKKVLNNETT